MDGEDYNSQYIQDQTGRAEQAANAAYQQGMLQYNNERLAFEKAQQAWKETMDKAGLTGMYEGQYTMPVQQWQASTFGTWGAPTQGQQTAAYEQQKFGQGATLGQMYGSYFGPGTTPTQGQQTLAGQQQQWSQGFQEQQEANRQAQLQQQNAQNYLQLLSSLRGPADWAKYQQVLGSTPGGMRDLAAAAMGQYIPGGGATTGVAPQAANLQTMLQQIQGGGYGQANPNNAQQTWQNAAYQTQAQPGQQYITQAGGGAAMTEQMLAGGLNPAVRQQQEQLAQQQQQARQAYNQQAMGGGTNAYGAPPTPNQQAGQLGQAQTAWGSGQQQAGGMQLNAGQQQQQNLPAPNQISPQAWKNMAPSQQQMLLGQYEAEGWHKPDVEALFAQSLPKYAANAATAGTFRMR
jgi:hypothetical protein